MKTMRKRNRVRVAESWWLNTAFSTVSNKNRTQMSTRITLTLFYSSHLLHLKSFPQRVVRTGKDQTKPSFRQHRSLKMLTRWVLVLARCTGPWHEHLMAVHTLIFWMLWRDGKRMCLYRTKQWYILLRSHRGWFLYRSQVHKNTDGWGLLLWHLPLDVHCIYFNTASEDQTAAFIHLNRFFKKSLSLTDLSASDFATQTLSAT